MYSGISTSTALTCFTLFPNLATELRLIIFNFALPTVRDDEECLVKVRKHRVLYLTPSRQAYDELRFGFDYSDSNHEQFNVQIDLGLLSVSRGSRLVYLKVFRNCVAAARFEGLDDLVVQTGVIRFDDETYMSFVESWWETRDPLCFLKGLRTVVVKPFWSGAEQKLEMVRVNMRRYEGKVGSQYVTLDILALMMMF